MSNSALCRFLVGWNICLSKLEKKKIEKTKTWDPENRSHTRVKLKEFQDKREKVGSG